MNTIDQHNLAELTKGGQPATAVGPLAPQDLAPCSHPTCGVAVGSPAPGYALYCPDHVGYALGVNDEEDYRIVERPDTDLVDERGDTAYWIALSLGYGKDNADKFRDAAMSAARVGLAPSGFIRTAGRVSLGTVKTFGGTVVTMSILLDSGAYYDPTRVSSPGNNSFGSD